MKMLVELDSNNDEESRRCLYTRQAM